VSAGLVEYEDTGGAGPTLVLLHGLLMNGSLWRDVVADLRVDHRCVVPTLPLGGHRLAMRPDADLTLRGQVRLVGELLDHLDLRDVTVVGNDWGGAQLLVAEGVAERVERLVLSSCEAFDNYPPGLPGRTAKLAARLPGGISMAVRQMRLRPLRRLPMTFGWMSKRPVPDAMFRDWMRPAQTDGDIRRDLRKYALSVPGRQVLLEWAERLREFPGPVLVAWASEDRIMPPEHGRRLAAMARHGRLVEIADSYTLVPIDQPSALAAEIRRFVAEPLP
jgi:pimeloyl-ACP methyl ester carboxylesterase